MKKIALTMALLLAAIAAGAQTEKALEPGIQYRFGLGWKFTDPVGYQEVSPEIGLGYRIDGKNLFGITLQGDCGYTHNRRNAVDHRASEVPLLSVYLTHTHDFSAGPKSVYFEYKLGLSDLENQPGPRFGFEPGYRFLAAGRVPLRVGAVFDGSRVFYPGKHENGSGYEDHHALEWSVGLVLRVEL
ncbi:MAG: hypothetical protein IJ721_03440 [Bacteroidales bacterium]|nr:hypothetical protein [Bacteroidales bacterium]